MIMLGIGKALVANKGTQDIGFLTYCPFSFSCLLLVFARTLVLGDQMKYYIYIT